MNINNKKIRIYSTALTGIMCAISIIISFCTGFIKVSFLGDYLTLNLSLVAIGTLVYLTNFFYYFSATIIVSIIGFLWSNGDWVGQIFNIVSNSLFILLINLSNVIFKEIKNNKLKYFLVLTLSLFLIAIINTILNGLIFFPLYTWSFNLLNSPSFIVTMREYEKVKIFLLYMPDYWSGVFATYISFNLLKFSVINFIIYTIILCLISSKKMFLYKKNANKKYLYMFL